MIKLIEAKNYRSIKYIHQPLRKFQVLVGANATGKTTFLDVINFIADIVKEGIDVAINHRATNYTELTFAAHGGDIELAIEVELPESVKLQLPLRWDIIRYEIRIGLLEQTKEHAILEERAILIDSTYQNHVDSDRLLFPSQVMQPASILNQKYVPKTYRVSIKKQPGGNDNFYDETVEKTGKGWIPSFKLGIKKTALGNLPADESKFPASTWLKEFLNEGIQQFILDSQQIKQTSAPGQPRRFKTDGSNLPWVIEELRKAPEKFDSWIEHIKTALPDIETISTIEREDIRHRYLQIHYKNGIIVPSWLCSDGTLRLLALTIPAYLPDFVGVYLIEEPENGVHPKAVECVYQSLSSVYNAQILMASHSPVLLAMVDAQDILCFAKNDDGSTDIVQGNKHPVLRDWKGEINISDLFSSGILG